VSRGFVFDLQAFFRSEKKEGKSFSFDTIFKIEPLYRHPSAQSGRIAFLLDGCMKSVFLAFFRKTDLKP